MPSVRQLRRPNHRGDVERSAGLAQLKFIISLRGWDQIILANPIFRKKGFQYIVLTALLIDAHVEKKRPDQWKDARLARADTALQQGILCIFSSLVQVPWLIKFCWWGENWVVTYLLDRYQYVTLLFSIMFWLTLLVAIIFRLTKRRY